jgi:hypothetical protein
VNNVICNAQQDAIYHADIADGAELIPVFLKVKAAATLLFVGSVGLKHYAKTSDGFAVKDILLYNWATNKSQAHCQSTHTVKFLKGVFHTLKATESSVTNSADNKTLCDCYVVHTTSKSYVEDLVFLRKCFSGRLEGYCQTLPL